MTSGAYGNLDDWDKAEPMPEPWRIRVYYMMRCCRALEWRPERVRLDSLVPTVGHLHLPEYCDQVKPDD